MSKYSDHTTVGGQVLAHRIRMMQQNWSIIWIIGRISFVFTFIFSLIIRWKINDVWNYLCILKAFYRNNISSLPVNIFSDSYFWFKSGHCQWLSDYVVAKHKGFLAAKAQFEDFLWLDLKISLAIGIISMLIMVFINKYFGKSLSDKKEIISGHDYVNAKILTKAINQKSDITLANIPYPKGTECRHTIITGTTGAGKTNVMIELLDQITNKPEKIVLVDTVGTYVDRYYKKGRDIILNPFHPDSLSWSFFNECSSNEDKNVSECLIESNNHYYDFWDKAARIVFVETAKKALKEGISTKEFLEILLETPLDNIGQYLEGTYGHTIMDIKADKMALSVRTTLINAISIFDVLKDSTEKNFSIRNWILTPHKDNQPHILFLSCKPAERASVIPLITAWLSIASQALLHKQQATERTWFFIDELHNLKRLPNIETFLAEIRKYCGCFVMGTQMISQLSKIYTIEVAKIITGLCGTKVVMSIPEPETAKYMSSFLGEKEEVSTAESISYGANTIRDGVNIAQKTEKKLTVPYSEIMTLKPGEAFLSFASIPSVAKVRFKFHESSITKN